VRNVSVLVAIGVGAGGHRAILGVGEGQREDLEGWRGFLRHLKNRGLARCSYLFPMAVLAWSKLPLSCFPRRNGNAAWSISIATYSAPSLAADCY